MKNRKSTSSFLQFTLAALLVLSIRALAADTLPPQNQPVNVTQSGGVPLTGQIAGSIPVTCVSGCSSSSSSGGGGAVYLLGGDGGILVSPLPGSTWPITQGGPIAVLVVQDGGWSIVVSLDGGITGVIQNGAWSTLMYYDGGPFQIQIPGDGGTLPVVVENSVLLNYSFASPLPVDNSEQTSCTQGVALCGLSGTAIGTVLAGAKSQLICNNGPNPICFGAVPGLSCAPAIDAGTVVGMPMFPGACLTENGSAQLYCVTATTAQTTVDAGTNWWDCN